MTHPDMRRLTAAPRIATMDGVSRREFIRRLGLGAAVLAGGPALLAACGTGTSGSTTTAAGGTTTTGAPSNELVIANWPFYIDVVEEDGYFDTTSLEDFEAATGIKVTYIEEVNDNDEWYGKYQAQLSQGQNIGRDMAMLTDWMAGRLVRKGWVDPIDKANVPNMANLRSALASPSFDPDRSYTLPWQSGLAGLGYDPNRTGRELTSVMDIFDPAFKGKVTMLTEMRDTVGLVMLGLGLDPSAATLADAEKAIAQIQEAVDSGQIRRFTGNDYTGELASGDVWVAFSWSGDLIQLQADNPDLRFAVPEEGAMLWSDNMLIPKGATNKANAEAFMNYVYDPAVAAKIESWVNYICPVEGAQAAMEDIDPELASDPLIFPDEATLAKTRIFKSLDDEEETQFNELFQAVIGA